MLKSRSSDVVLLLLHRPTDLHKPSLCSLHLCSPCPCDLCSNFLACDCCEIGTVDCAPITFLSESGPCSWTEKQNICLRFEGEPGSRTHRYLLIFKVAGLSTDPISYPFGPTNLWILTWDVVCRVSSMKNLILMCSIQAKSPCHSPVFLPVLVTMATSSCCDGFRVWSRCYVSAVRTTSCAFCYDDDVQRMVLLTTLNFLTFNPPTVKVCRTPSPRLRCRWCHADYFLPHIT